MSSSPVCDKKSSSYKFKPIFSSAPLAYEPFSTLAMIYEDNEDMNKALQFGLIAAHLNPSDCEEWIRMAEMSLEQDNIRQAIICYSKGQSLTVTLCLLASFGIYIFFC